MPKVYSVIEVRPWTWGKMVVALAFFLTTTMVLSVLFPMERSKRRLAEEARERLTVHAHRLAQAKQELQKEVTEERERKQAILAALNEAKIEVSSLREQLSMQTSRVTNLVNELAQEQQLRIHLEAAMTDQQQKASASNRSSGSGVELGKIVVGKSTNRTRVLRVIPEMGFVIVGIGKEMAMEPGQLIDILRDHQVIAKARIEKVSSQLCSAKVLPEWSKVAIRELDEVNLSSQP